MPSGGEILNQNFNLPIATVVPNLTILTSNKTNTKAVSNKEIVKDFFMNFTIKKRFAFLHINILHQYDFSMA